MVLLLRGSMELTSLGFRLVLEENCGTRGCQRKGVRLGSHYNARRGMTSIMYQLDI